MADKVVETDSGSSVVLAVLLIVALLAAAYFFFGGNFGGTNIDVNLPSASTQ